MNDNNKFILLQYSMAHCLIDLVCAVSLFSIWYLWSPGILLMQKIIFIYSFLAFGLQPVLGWLSDAFSSPKLFAVLGCILSALGIMLLPFSFWFTVVLAGLGNTLFHVGGGSISLNLTPYKSLAPGIFVAPGVIGLTLGTIIGMSNSGNIWFFSGILIIMAIVLFFTKHSQDDKKIHQPQKNRFWLISLILIFFVIIGRSLLGFSWDLPWKSDLTLLLLMVLGVSLGKGVGGFLADKYGFTLVAVLGLILSAPMLIFYSNLPVVAILGIFLFQFTMPVTLTVMYRLFPKHPGFAFGLPCLALFLGALPILTQNQENFRGFNFITISFIVITVITFTGLKLMPEYLNKK